MATMAEQAGIDTILVGDSAETAMMGRPNTLVDHAKMRSPGYLDGIGHDHRGWVEPIL